MTLNHGRDFGPIGQEIAHTMAAKLAAFALSLTNKTEAASQMQHLCFVTSEIKSACQLKRQTRINEDANTQRLLPTSFNPIGSQDGRQS